MTAKAKKITESEFQQQVIQLAKLYRWKVAHFRPLMNRRGQWSTPVAADGAGFPDLILVGGPYETIAAVELKVGKNKTTPEQEDWLNSFRDAGVKAFVWRPEDWTAIELFLTGRVASADNPQNDLGGEA